MQSKAAPAHIWAKAWHQIQLRRPLVTGGRESLGLAVLVAAAAIILGEKQRRRQREKSQTWYEWLVSHPLIAWLIENSCVVGAAWLGVLVVPHPRIGSFAAAVRHMYIGSTLQVWSIMAAQKFLTDGVYGHISTFTSKGRPQPTFLQYVKEFCFCNAPVDLFNSMLLGSSIATFDAKKFKGTYANRNFSPLKVIRALAIVRFCVDFGFWAGHRVLHFPSIYKLIHRRHHEHHKPALITNFHFSPPDLWIEGAMPLFIGLATMDNLDMRMTNFEVNVVAGYILWHLQGSHCGKPLPTVTFFPPLAPLYQLLCGPVDLNNVRHHDVHHARLNGNYGITIWPDIVMGTRLHEHDHRAETKLQ